MKKFLIAASALFVSTTLWAEGYQINTLSAKQLGMGHAGVALKLGSESMIFNPAGLGFSNKTIDLSGSITGIKAIATAKYEGEKYTTENGLSTPLAVNASFKIFDNLQGGISFYTPYGSGINWTNDWPGSVLSEKVDLKMFTIQPTVAWRITPKLSVGLGMMITWGNVNLDKALVSGASFDEAKPIITAGLAQRNPQLAALVQSSPSLGHSAAASVNLTGTSQMSFGANIGVMYEISNQWTVGASFRTKMQMKVKAGDVKVSYANEIAKGVLEQTCGLIHEANFKAAMPAPYVLNFGVAYKPIEKLQLALDAQLTGWKTYKTLNIALPDHLASFAPPIPKEYSNAWCFKLGAQYALTERLDLRAGCMFDTTPVNKNYYNPETPGMTKIEPTIGFSFRPVKNLSVDFAFMYVAGLGVDNAKVKYENLLQKSLGLPYEHEFVADYSVHAFTPSIGLSYSF